MRLATFALALSLSALPAAAKSPDSYFHAGANKFVAGRLQEATIQVEEGLRLFPNDAKLKSLLEELKRLKDQQKKDQGQAGNQGSDQNKDKDKDKDKKEDKKQDSQGQDKQDEKKQDEQKPEEGKQDQDKRDSSGQQAEEQKPVKPGEMSKEDAERLLNSFQDDEKKEHRRMGKPGRKIEVEEDW